MALLSANNGLLTVLRGLTEEFLIIFPVGQRRSPKKKNEKNGS
jgi:hypothetical protein